jgi:hypothetical protein
MFREYNAGMGGVDLMDNMVACYRVPYRIKKWWFPFYTWSIRFVHLYLKIIHNKLYSRIFSTLVFVTVPYLIVSISSVSAVNAWRMRMRTKGRKEPFLDFLRELCIEMLTIHGSPPIKKRSTSAGPEELRCDIKIIVYWYSKK